MCSLEYAIRSDSYKLYNNWLNEKRRPFGRSLFKRKKQLKLIPSNHHNIAMAVLKANQKPFYHNLFKSKSKATTASDYINEYWDNASLFEDSSVLSSDLTAVEEDESSTFGVPEELIPEEIGLYYASHSFEEPQPEVSLMTTKPFLIRHFKLESKSNQPVTSPQPVELPVQEKVESPAQPAVEQLETPVKTRVASLVAVFESLCN